jgi:hypothetical protein
VLVDDDPTPEPAEPVAVEVVPDTLAAEDPPPAESEAPPASKEVAPPEPQTEEPAAEPVAEIPDVPAEEVSSFTVMHHVVTLPIDCINT